MKITDLLNDSSLLKEVNNDNLVELTTQLKEVDLKTSTPEQVDTVISFIEKMDNAGQEEYLDYIISNCIEDEITEPYRTILLKFPVILQQLANSN